MCGLTGFLDASRGTSEDDLLATVRRMAATIDHRGPDDEGAWADERAGIAFGFRRLAIVDLSEQGRQPMASAGGRFKVVFNGEIYNHAALRAELEREGGGSWRGHSDTETLLAGFERWGIAATLTRTVGMFALALWDRDDRSLTLARDRFGEKPMYYGWMGSNFLFGSELKALRAHPGFRGEIDRDALIPFLRHKYIPAPLTIYRNIFKLPPAGLVTVRADEVRRTSTTAYWSAADAAQRGARDRFGGSDEEAVELLDARLRETIGLQMLADVPLGAFLSGGVDSSTIVALMQAQSAQPIKTFTIGFWEPSHNEAPHAKAIAAHLGTDHTELYVTAEDALAVVPELPRIYDEPFADVSGIPTFLVSQLARRRVTVSLSGDGGDELFSGYERYAVGERRWGRLAGIPRTLRAGVGAGISAVPADGWDRLLDAARPVLRRADIGAAISGDRLRKLGGMIGAESAEAMYQEQLADWANAPEVVRCWTEEPTPLSLGATRPTFAEVRERLMFADLTGYLPDDILVKVDRASMAASLESRAPFLDHRVMELAWSLPMSMKVRDGEAKWILRQVLDRYVPRSLVERPKMGFTMPIAAWLRGPLRPWAETLLAADQLKRDGFFAVAPIRRKLREHMLGERDWAYLLWDVLMFQSWLEAQRDGSGTERGR